MSEMPPVIGDWYRRADRPQVFQVVAIDSEAGTVDIEYFDGTVDEWPMDHWLALEIERCEPPQDWSGPFDDVERDDLGDTDSGMAPEDWREPVEGAQDQSARRELQDEAREIRPVVRRARRKPVAVPHKPKPKK